jgi:hypothetical protein
LKAAFNPAFALAEYIDFPVFGMTFQYPFAQKGFVFIQRQIPVFWRFRSGYLPG